MQISEVSKEHRARGAPGRPRWQPCVGGRLLTCVREGGQEDGDMGVRRLPRAIRMRIMFLSQQEMGGRCGGKVGIYLRRRRFTGVRPAVLPVFPAVIPAPWEWLGGGFVGALGARAL